MEGSVTVHMNAPADKIWNLIADVRNTGKFSPEVFEAEWLDGATGPALGAKFRGHVKRNEIGPVYWTVCRVTACDPGKEFGFAVLGPGDQAINNWDGYMALYCRGQLVCGNHNYYLYELSQPTRF